MRREKRKREPCATLVDVLRDCAYDRAVLLFIRAVREREPDTIRQKLREKLARRVHGLDVESDVELAVRGLCRIVRTRDAPF
jgi:hypothetical protein